MENKLSSLFYIKTNKYYKKIKTIHYTHNTLFHCSVDGKVIFILQNKYLQVVL